MLGQIVGAVPERWRDVAGVALAPIVWIPPMQGAIAQFFFASSSLWIAAAKYVLVLFPAVLWVVAVWCTQCSLYTLPFRSQRQAFVATMLVMWWDAARAVWLYWGGILRLAVVLVGWSALFVSVGLKLMARGAVRLALLPFTTGGRMAKRYAERGVPWIAILMFRFWCFLEATVFTYVLFPTVSKLLARLLGANHAPALTASVLYLLVLLLIRGSFACLQALADAIRRRERKWLAQVVVMGLSVMVFEVTVLYRELVHAAEPWIANQLGEGLQLGLWFTLVIPLTGWVGVRSMTWLLFGQFRTPSPLPMRGGRAGVEPTAVSTAAPLASAARSWRAELEEVRRGMGWMHAKSDELLEYLALPVLTVLAVALNFGVVLVTSRPVFALPFKGLKDVTDTGTVLAAVAPPPTKGVGA